jgi:hypothetical protein
LNVLVVTDIGNDYDDMMAILMLGYFHSVRWITLKGIIVTLDPVDKRARMALGMLQNCMKIKDVPVACGTKGTDVLREAEGWTKEALTADFLAPRGTEFPNYLELSKTVFEQAIRNGETIRLLSIAGLRDTWTIVQQNPALFKAVVSEVHIQGGVNLDPNHSDTLLPRDDARNNKDDMNAAYNFYNFILQEQIYSVVYEKEAAFMSGFKKDFFDPRQASTQMRPVAEYIYKIHDRQKTVFYEDAIKEPGQRHREICDRKWFIMCCTADLPARLRDTQCKASEIIPYTTVTPYDPIAALGCCRDLVRFPMPMRHVRGRVWSVGTNVDRSAGSELVKGICKYMKKALKLGKPPDV